MRYFGWHKIDSVAERSVEGTLSWVEVGGCGWRSLHGLDILISNLQIPIHFLLLDVVSGKNETLLL